MQVLALCEHTLDFFRRGKIKWKLKFANKYKANKGILKICFCSSGVVEARVEVFWPT